MIPTDASAITLFETFAEEYLYSNLQKRSQWRTSDHSKLLSVGTVATGYLALEPWTNPKDISTSSIQTNSESSAGLTENSKSFQTGKRLLLQKLAWE